MQGEKKKKEREREKKKKKGWPSQNLLYTAWKELGVAQQGVISVPQWPARILKYPASDNPGK